MPVATALLFEAASCARSCRSRGEGRAFPDAVAPSRAASTSGLSRSYGVRRASRPAHARAHVSCRTPHHARAVGCAAVVLAVIRSVSYLGMWGDTNANISHGAAVALHRHDRSGRLRRGVRLRRARAPGRCRVADPIPACCCSSWWVCSSYASGGPTGVARVPHRGHRSTKAVRAPLVLDRRGNGARRCSTCQAVPRHR